MRLPRILLVGIMLPSLAVNAVAQQNRITITFNGKTYDLEMRSAVDRDNLWQFEQGGLKKLFVCWDNPQDQFAKEMEAVKVAVTASWQANSGLQFIGWGPCIKNSPGIRILIKDDANDGPQVMAFGRKLNGVENGMILNFTFKKWMPACQQGPMLTWIQRIAVHEFGHALGFRHEQDRDDTIGKDTNGEACKNLKTGPNPDWHLTTYDAKSIMNYCYCEASSNLSELDVLSVQALYGRP